MAICKEHVYSEWMTWADTGEVVEEVLYYGPHLWVRVNSQWEFVVKPKPEPTNWWQRTFGVSTDIFDALENTGRVRRKYYCQYCRVHEERVEDLD